MRDVPSIRLFVTDALVAGSDVACDKAQTNYLVNVLRLDDGAEVAVFNGVDGEWCAKLRREGKRSVWLVPTLQLRAQTKPTDLQYIFAPLKRSRLDYMVQKAVELGASRLTPVFTDYCQVARVNLDRMRSNVIEAAEQCRILQIAEVDNPLKLIDLLGEWDEDRALVFCDEACHIKDPLRALAPLKGKLVSVLIGPEGGFSPEERDLLAGQKFVTSLSLGPRIMRADTAAVAALSLVNGVIGDWS